MNKNIKYKRKKSYVVTSMYSGQVMTSKKRGHKPPEYTKKELFDWLYSKTKFHILYDEWVKSKFNRFKKPSLDRIDNSKGYSFSNVKLMTWRENLLNSHIDFRNGKLYNKHKKVAQYDKNDKLINVFHSINEACRKTGTQQASISRCCSGVQKTAGGFKWKYL